jgi:hypothetical protein
MLFFTKRILVEYKSLVMHMFDEHALNTIIKGNLDLLCDVETFLGLSYIIRLNVCNLCQSLFKFEMYSSVILLMQLKHVKEIYTNYMLIQL